MKLPVALVFAALLSTLQAQTERITDFTSTIEVQFSGDLLVTESISVIAAGDQIKRGIYRDFPTLYRQGFGLKRRVAFDVRAVERDGRPEPWHPEARENGLRIYLGASGVFVPPGPHTYRLTYRTNRQLVQRPDFDELYWNVTGNQWAFPIDHATARVRLPEGAKVTEINAFTGPAGAQGHDWKIVALSNWAAVIETTRPLAPDEGLTISVTWPKGSIAPNANPGGVEEIIQDNTSVALDLAGLVVVIAYYVVAWFAIGRDPRRGVIIPRYQPPAGFNAPAVRYLAGLGRFDDKSFAAAVMELAVAGAVKIRQSAAGKFTLERGGTPPAQITPGYRPFYDGLLGSRDSLELDDSQHLVFQAARTTLRKSLLDAAEKRFFYRNSGWWLGGLLLSLVPAGIALHDARNGTAAVFMLVWLSFWSVGVLMLLSTAAAAWKSRQLVTAVPTSLFALPFVLGWMAGAWMLMQVTSPWTLGTFALAFLLNAIFHHLLKAPTLEGRRVMDEIDGFKRYLSVGEQDRLNLENPPERTPAQFEAFLPYALALDVEQKWAEQFTHVLTASQLQPGWYQGSGTSVLTPMAFASAMGGAFAGAIASSSSAPGSSSGSGGGGSSGGGGGGGGGGGW